MNSPSVKQYLSHSCRAALRLSFSALPSAIAGLLTKGGAKRAKIVAAALSASTLLIEPAEIRTYSLALVRQQLNGTRWIDFRLTGTTHSPCRTSSETKRCAPAVQYETPHFTRLAWLKSRLSQRFFRDRQPGLLHAVALSSIPFEREIGKIAGDLQRAFRKSPGDFILLSDYAAVLAEQARQEADPQLYIQALELVLTCTARPDAPLEAFFNQALILSRLNVPGAAAAWHRYLAMDPASDWSEEARTHLEQLRDQPSRPNADPLREMIWTSLGNLEQLSPEDRAKTIEKLSAEARQIHDSTADPLLEESVELLEQNLGTERIGDHIRAYALFRQGKREFEKTEKGAWDSMLRAKEIFDRLGDPFKGYAEFYLGALMLKNQEHSASLPYLENLDSSLEGKSYWHLRGQIGWLAGLGQLMVNRPVEAEEFYRRALEHDIRAASPENQAAQLSLLGELAFKSGQTAQAWNFFSKALELKAYLRQPKRAATVFQPIVKAAHEQKLYRSAAFLSNVAIANNRRVEEPQILFYSLVARAWIFTDQGDLQRAGASFRAASLQATRISGEKIRARARADLAVLDAALAETLDEALLTEVDAAIHHYVATDLKSFVHNTALELRADLNLQAGRMDQAAADLESSTSLFENGFLASPASSSRWSMGEEMSQLYDRLIRVVVDELDDPPRGFEIAERSKEFSLLSFDFPASRAAKQQRPLKLDELQSRLQEGWILVTYRLAGDRLWIWQVSRNDIAFDEKQVSRAQIQEAVGTLVRAGVDTPHYPRNEISFLADLLLGEVSPRYEGLIVIPDQELHSLPFGLLTAWREEDGRPRPIITAPSAGIYLESRNLLSQRRASAKVLIISEPEISAEIWGDLDLDDLPSADIEGSYLETLYPGALHLSGAGATVEAFERAAESMDIIHFATHAVIDPDRPENSKLLLSPSGSDSGALFQNDIYRLHFENAPLIVLSACDTGALSGIRGEGISSLARAFLSSGASAVLATMWPVEDTSAAFLATAFHRELRAGATAAGALHRAQISFLKDPKLVQADPMGWSAFQLIGASQ